MPKFQLLSDLHLEFHQNFQEEILLQLKTDADYLILAGDICEGRNFEQFKWFFEWCSLNYKKVLFIAGNHEHYNSPNIWQDYEKMCKSLNKNNLHLLSLTKPLYIDTDIIIIGNTTWTNYNNGDPLVMLDCDRMINDRRATGLDSHTIYDEHNLLIDNLKQTLDNNKDKKIILVTHHPITENYLEHSRFKGDKLNGGFSSNYNQLILDNPQIKVICSGHTHDFWQDKIGNTNYYINPFGYPAEAKQQYKPLTFTIN